MLTPRRKILLAGLVIFLVFGALAIFASPLSARNLEARLQDAADEALYSVRAEGWAEVRMDGQVAIVTGLAPDQDAQSRALDAVSRAAWAGGIVAGGITRVIDETRVDLQDTRFRLRADLIGSRLTLSGFAPDAVGQARLNDLAVLLFPGRASVDVQLAPGGAPANWEAAARLMLGELARLDTGSAVMAGDRLVVTGLSTNAQTVASVRSAMSNAPAGYVATALVRAPGGTYEAEITDFRLCEAAVNAALGPRPVAFTPGSAQLNEASRNTLRRAGEAFARCDTPPLGVAVQVNEGEGGEALALDRARSVIDAMSAAGLEEDRFLASTLPGDGITALRFEIQAPVEAQQDTGAEPVSAPEVGEDDPQ
jgi:hypothetical protein